MKQAVILAAGEGQRLRPFTVSKPKSMLFIAGRPILDYVVESLARIGIRSIVLVVGYRKEQVFDYMGSGERLGVDIAYVIQENQLGTGHALLQAREKAQNEFLVLPGDTLIDPDTIAQFAQARPEAMLVKKVADPMRYGVVFLERGRLKSITEKPKLAASNLVSTGIYAFSRSVFDFLENRLDIPDALNEMVARGIPIEAVETDGTWLDILYPWDILGANDAILRKAAARFGGIIESGVSLRGQVTIGKGTVIRSNSYIVGPVVIGDGCDIGPSAHIQPATSIGNNVIISSFTALKNSVIGNDVNIGSGCIIEDSVIDLGCVIKGNFTACSGQTEVTINSESLQINMGAILGEGCSLGNNVVAQPGVILGNYSQVQPLKLISGRLPDRSLVY
ncbi:MAG: NTP transferase domain-containing protein [Chloroflexi bacterium]|nr:NTP transferase domain-containing protein [Chloroflexota bacterium]